jgi:histone H3/H4
MIIEPPLKRKKTEKKEKTDLNNTNQDSNEPATKQVKPNQKVQLFKKGDKVLDIMKKSIPIPNVEISRDLKGVVDKCACEFIGNITCLAEDICILENRNEVTGEDISFALKNLGMENYSDAINIYLTKYRDAKALKNSS